MKNLPDLFSLEGRVAIITGGAGLLGVQHALAIHAFGGIPIIADVDETSALEAARRVGPRAFGVRLDVTDHSSIDRARDLVLCRFKQIDILINNAALNPKVEQGNRNNCLGRLEDLDPKRFNEELAVGLSGAVFCSQRFGEVMAERGRGVILNIASDLALIAPDQRLYSKTGNNDRSQPKKPVGYSVVKTGLLGLTRYLATYWAERGIRANALCPGGVENGQPKVFLQRISKLIPLRRMAQINEYQGAVVFMCSDASAYMNGSILSVDGGRSVW
jgi:NAD(P)-dependent dehydrogenase (short-subunit alcohol dehydrogenase family)